MDISKQLNTYIYEISSSSPTPGGGNVSAFSGVLACSLGIMVCNLTYGKKKYHDVEEELKEVQQKLESSSKELLSLAEKDNEAFNSVMEAFKLPKGTEEQIKERSKKIDEATFQAAKIPADVIELCEYVLPLLTLIEEKGNQNSLSDVGVAVSLLNTAVQGAYYNVLINCSVLNMEHEHISDLMSRADLLHNSLTAKCSEISNNLINKLSKK
jgi:methenyltetrahydrofolate cyclohydrolase